MGVHVLSLESDDESPSSRKPTSSAAAPGKSLTGAVTSRPSNSVAATPTVRMRRLGPRGINLTSHRQDGSSLPETRGYRTLDDSPKQHALRNRRRPAASRVVIDSDDDDDDLYTGADAEKENADQDLPADEESEFIDESRLSDTDSDRDSLGDIFSRERTGRRTNPPSVRLLGQVLPSSRPWPQKDLANGMALQPAPDTLDGSKPRDKSNTKDGNPENVPLGQISQLLRDLELSDYDTGVEGEKHATTPRLASPPRTPKAERAGTRKVGLVSPKKLAAIPQTPHRPSTDGFWSQVATDKWNETHSPKKLTIPPTQRESKRASPKKTGQEVRSSRDTKRSFEAKKLEIAESFLRELDSSITGGRLRELAASTGGVKLVWTNKLNTTAGRANWKRETTRTKSTANGTSTIQEQHRHHASIELAEKVIDDELRLLNVIAHEFCHLANFMVSGITGNPHGKEFKAWARQVSAAFGDRGIEVTTKHSYDIDFKYVWECVTCAAEYKRHSKSINLERHRCGSCKGELRQTKPAPRATTGKVSAYQKFVSENMKKIREENPGSPQKEVMRMVAERWGLQGKTAVATSAGVGDLADQLHSLELESSPRRTES